jgi:hypothetical protein
MRQYAAHLHRRSTVLEIVVKALEDGLLEVSLIAPAEGFLDAFTDAVFLGKSLHPFAKLANNLLRQELKLDWAMDYFELGTDTVSRVLWVADNPATRGIIEALQSDVETGHVAPKWYVADLVVALDSSAE